MRQNNNKQKTNMLTKPNLTQDMPSSKKLKLIKIAKATWRGSPGLAIMRSVSRAMLASRSPSTRRWYSICSFWASCSFILAKKRIHVWVYLNEQHTHQPRQIPSVIPISLCFHVWGSPASVFDSKQNGCGLPFPEKKDNVQWIILIWTCGF